jgi:hypothetical protein
MTFNPHSMTVTLLAGCVTCAAHAETLLVPEEYPTIQAAIDASADGDEIVVADGVYTGDGNRDMDFGGRDITVRSANGPEDCIIDLQGSPDEPHRAFTFVFEGPEGGAEGVVAGFTIQNGWTEFGGGAVLISDDSLSPGCPTFESCVFRNNTAGVGGAVSASPNATFIACDFRHNTAESGGAVWGVRLTFIACDFVANSASTGGGAVTVHYGWSSFVDCRFIGNWTAGPWAYGAGGGAVEVSSSVDATCFCARASFERCDFRDNAALSSGGGAVAVYWNAQVDLVDCLLVDNAADQGGAIWVGGPGRKKAVVVNSALVGNEAATGGAIWASVAGNHPGEADLHNSILRGNSPDQIVGDGFFVDVSHSNVQGGWAGEGNIDSDPLFADPDNGDFRLLSGSPCIDAGSNVAVPPESTHDLDGNPRIVDGDLDGIATVDGDGTADVHDLVAVILDWGTDGSSHNGDVDGSSVVDADDLVAVILGWGCTDCNLNGLRDDDEIAAGLSADCDDNGVPDDCDVAAGTSADCNGNEVPDDCELGELDCNGNGVPDDCDIADGASPDCRARLQRQRRTRRLRHRRRRERGLQRQRDTGRVRAGGVRLQRQRRTRRLRHRRGREPGLQWQPRSGRVRRGPGREPGLQRQPRARRVRPGKRVEHGPG